MEDKGDSLTGMEFERAPGQWEICRRCAKHHDPDVVCPDACDELIEAMVSHIDHPGAPTECLEVEFEKEGETNADS